MTPSVYEKINTKKGRVLYTVAAGENLTKAEIKQSTGLSMTTVITCVDALVKEGLITLELQKVKGGGKPHSMINVCEGKCVYGISYKSGVLTALSIGLKGEIKREHTQETKEGELPSEQVYSLTQKLIKEGEPPLAIALAFNFEGREEVAERLERSTGAKVLLITNTAAIAYRALWQGSPLPVLAIGVGNTVKCACLDEKRCRVTDMGALLSAPAFCGKGDYRSLLSAARVEKVLRSGDYGGHYELCEAGLMETRDLPSYSRALARSVAAVTEIAHCMCAPQEIYLFGEYLTQGFFDRVCAFSRVGDSLRRESGERLNFAYGAALCGLTEGVFNE
ncbi:MAG TPA: hypothetical protein DIC18_02485 [Clostridiales bacterium]|nr:hypothetical protein [Clostridiales bacterium]